MTRRRLLGAVLAGGRSRRYGRPKHTEDVGGVPMIERAIEQLAHVTERVVVVSGRPVDGVDPARMVPDRVHGLGPLGGLQAALHQAAEDGLDGVFLLACDLPLVDVGVLCALAEAGPGPVVAPARGDGGIEPLCAVYSIDVLAAVDRRVAGDDLSLHGLFREARGHTVSLGAEAFLNVNTPADRDRAEAALRKREVR